MLIFPGNMKKIALFWGVASLLVACTAQLETPVGTNDDPIIVEEQAPVLYASISDEAQTKVYLDEDYKVLWTADDRISVFNKNTYNQQYKFDGATGDNAGTFSIVEDGKLKVSNDIENLYAVYPYNESTSISNTGVLTVNFPAAQTYSATSFGQGSNTMVAVTDGTNMQFKNACGYLMFKLYGTSVSVKSISLKGNNNEKIAGAATVTMPLSGTPSVAMSGSATDEIVLTCTDAVAIGNSSSNYTEFWFAIPPVTFSGGFTITVTDNTGKVFTKSTSSSLEIVRSYAKKMAPIEVVPVTIPLGFFALTAQEDGTIALTNHGTNAPDVEYSLDGQSWTQWDYSAIAVSEGNTVLFRGQNESGFNSNPWGNYSSFTTTGRFTVSGSIQSLLCGDDYEDNLTIPNSYCFARLFYNCTGLTAIDILPALSLTHRCYYQMFEGCTNLVKAPVLPALTMAQMCYEEMFSGCTSLVTAPDLPATSLYNGCYSNMFSGCTSLTKAPELSATTLETSCYDSMFRNCTSLSVPPQLPATTLEGSCYNNMFSGCTSLATAPDLPATTLASSCYQSMFFRCTSLVTAPELPATSLEYACYASMFYGCTSLSEGPALPATTLAENCYNAMFYQCSNLTVAPVLPATTLETNCYREMFYQCSQLSYIKMLATNVSASGCLSAWVYGVKSSGTFVKNTAASWNIMGMNGVPSGWTVETADN